MPRTMDPRVVILDIDEKSLLGQEKGGEGRWPWPRDRLALLESIIHPAVAERRKLFLASHQDADIILFDIPLLFEKGGQAGVDVTVVVSAPAAVQRVRVLARTNMTAEKFEHILALQMDDAEKRARADHIIDTGKDIAETRADVQALVKKLRAGLA